jgi:PTH1 family peptidyl-tRNA hydrolase
MNRSGQAVAGLARYFNIPPECMLVAHDDLDLPPGTVRLKLGGGEGGHNGLRDLVAHLGTRNFWRLRIGIGHPGHRDQVLAYVLERPNRADEEAMMQALECALAETPRLFDGELEKVMHVLHSRKVSNTLPTGAGD